MNAEDRMLEHADRLQTERDEWKRAAMTDHAALDAAEARIAALEEALRAAPVPHIPFDDEAEPDALNRWNSGEKGYVAWYVRADNLLHPKQQNTRSALGFASSSGTNDAAGDKREGDVNG